MQCPLKLASWNNKQCWFLPTWKGTDNHSCMSLTSVSSLLGFKLIRLTISSSTVLCSINSYATKLTWFGLFEHLDHHPHRWPHGRKLCCAAKGDSKNFLDIFLECFVNTCINYALLAPHLSRHPGNNILVISKFPLPWPCSSDQLHQDNPKTIDVALLIYLARVSTLCK